MLLCVHVSVKRIFGAYRVVAFSEQEMFEKVQVYCTVVSLFNVWEARQDIHLASILRGASLRLLNSVSDANMSCLMFAQQTVCRQGPDWH